MPRPKFQTLTEQMFYILLCLKTECYGIDLFDRIAEKTNRRVTVGSGTLYNLLEQFLDAGMIREVKVEGRRRSYILTDMGKDVLAKEYQRLLLQAADYSAVFGGED
ncbi:MAG: PadR family transcriptional regulator [Lachnospiraceae bacterium]|nr:PadR family transcriptional regulator [Lachnospiraceae bacterium]